MTDYKFKAEESLEYGKNNDDGKVYYAYRPSTELAKAVQLAIDLQRPLLLEGSPGCGKTQLAYALARQLVHNNPKEEWPFFIWNVKSTSRARDGVYEFDTLARLRDAQLAAIEQKPATAKKAPVPKSAEEQEAERERYVKYGPLGYAIKEYQESGKRAVLLIDEIDKGNRDFGNDLLYELEQFAFKVTEVEGEPIPFACPADQKPIVIITSNRDKPLPDALLRRCLYFKIPFPNEDELKKIVRLRFSEESVPDKLFDAAFARFDDVRKVMRSPINRKPSTSEFLDLLSALAKNPKKKDEILAAAQDNPYLGILLKTEDDLELYQKHLGGQKKS